VLNTKQALYSNYSSSIAIAALPIIPIKKPVLLINNTGFLLALNTNARLN
jgi:hypothetical protein